MCIYTVEMIIASRLVCKRERSNNVAHLVQSRLTPKAQEASCCHFMLKQQVTVGP